MEEVCKQTLCDEKSNSRSSAHDINESSKYKRGENDDVRNGDDFRKHKTVTWTRLTIVFDRLLLCVFIFLQVVISAIVFIVVPIIVK